MHFSLIHVSEKPSAWLQAACSHYSSRLPPEFGFSDIVLPPARRTKNSHLATLRSQEWLQICAKVPKSSALVLLDERGKSYSSAQFSQQIQRWQQAGQDICFVIAGADGVNPEHRQQVSSSISLSAMTLPHEMARLMLLEQLYRAWSIAANHPYHRV
ncbi:MAG: 23S rRNA (pseudouridine(1915)-N(3))-methyltransferase RlmH [Gammaproteobacteria bacterium TMED119]|nr:MAG: 23S rRNA (pseudouridine(1915)-N(3))-methyltransferase RlmH [Gammaproteobacteria bacterium TMED119]RCL46594.1 MAG: 23S rRNA (pseudouridine(1915)-N(3))-methyltransferase RlmH [Candidatus Thioglobus sp.]|tara:strand:+ start:958 stop:1428 length:471 start_codon:yes stop_codon:yes gene_type:complete